MIKGEKGSIKIDDLYFGVRYFDSNNHELKISNIFNSPHIKYQAAKLVKYKHDDKMDLIIGDVLHFVFGDVWSRVEYEMLVAEIFPSHYKDGTHYRKMDIFDMYIVPNKDLLMDMISQVTYNSAIKYIREYNKKWKK